MLDKKIIKFKIHLFGTVLEDNPYSIEKRHFLNSL